MYKIAPIYISRNGDSEVNKIVGINVGRVDNNLQEEGGYTKIRYYHDPDKETVDILLTPDSPAAIYREMDKEPLDIYSDITLSLVGGGTATINIADVVYCYLDPATHERCSIDVFVSSRRTLYKIDMTFMELLLEINTT